MKLKIYYDSFQEGSWFQRLHPLLSNAELSPFPKISEASELLSKALSYDRPDIILTDNDTPILVLERTIEVPSGHNVGQRFSRLVAAAVMKVPVVYFGPYAAYKHGGATQGPRYMNLRLFYALKKMAEIEASAVTIINWPVDSNYEIIRSEEKDEKVKQYLELFFTLYLSDGLPNMISKLMNSQLEVEFQEERRKFITSFVSRPNNYDLPPTSVISDLNSNIGLLQSAGVNNLRCNETVLYNIGMTYIRSDPYTGMCMLYSYLYCGGFKDRIRNLVLYFPNISQEMWRVAATSATRKDIRLYKFAADGIIFSDGYLSKFEL